MKYAKAEPGDKIAFTYATRGGVLGELMEGTADTARRNRLRYWGGMGTTHAAIETVPMDAVTHLRRIEPERIVAGARFAHHKKGTIYEVLVVTNRRSDDAERFPVEVVYFEADDPAARAKPFSKSVNRFLATMIPLEHTA